jgi:hypothetical protein
MTEDEFSTPDNDITLTLESIRAAMTALDQFVARFEAVHPDDTCPLEREHLARVDALLSEALGEFD